MIETTGQGMGDALVGIADRLRASAKRAAQRIAAEAAAGVATEALLICPMDTGTLAGTIKPLRQSAGTDGYSFEVGTNCEYAVKLEFGGGVQRSRFPGAPTEFMRPALKTIADALPKKAAEILRQEMARK